MGSEKNDLLHARTAVAIIGMGGRFPGAFTPADLWRTISTGKRSISLFTDEELRNRGFDLVALRNSGYVAAGSVLEAYDRFDAAFFGYTPREAETMDPQHRLLLECAWESLEAAGYASETHAHLVGVFAGSAFSTYLLNNLYTDASFIDLVGEIAIAIGNDKDSLASTVSYKLNLKGPSVSVQTFCSTSLVAVHLACQSLLTYECDMALAGGVAIQVPQGQGYEYQEGGILSPDGHCRTFDARARGSVMGSGVGLVVLRRLEDALRDGDQIYAVIRGSAVNNDGGVRAGYTAPSVDGQAEVIAEALAHAEVSADTIGYIEAHGTATPLGDAVELAAMIKAFGGRTAPKGTCAIGSIKPNVGHLDRAAGVTGLIKVVQALRHKRLPPQIEFERPNPEIDLDNSPFYVNTEAREWKRGQTPRRAGVSSFGLGGTNAHVVLEEAPEPEPSSPARPWELLVISAKTPAALEQATTQLADHLAADPTANLGDVAYTLQAGRCAFNHRRMVVCRNPADAAAALSARDPQRVFTAETVRRGSPVAFLFPGLGDQYVGMARELYQFEPVFRTAFDECASIAQTVLEIDLRDLLYPSMPARHLTPLATATELPALFAIEYALARLLMDWGIQPSVLVGYSLGEYVAGAIGGVLTLKESMTICCGIVGALGSAPRGAMLAIAAEPNQLRPLLPNGTELVAQNSANCCIVSGGIKEIAELEESLGQTGTAARRLSVEYAFHSRRFAEATASVSSIVEAVKLRAPEIPVLSCSEGAPLAPERAQNARFWLLPIHGHIRFLQAMTTLLADEETAILELGPGPALAAFLRQHPRCTPNRVIATVLPRANDRSDISTLLETTGKLWLAGVNVDWKRHHSATRKRQHLPSYPFEQQRHWVDLKTGQWKFESAEVDGTESAIREPMEDWTFQHTWARAPLRNETDRATLHRKSPWVIIMDEFGIGSELAGALRSHECLVVQVSPGHTYGRISKVDYNIRTMETEDWHRLFSEMGSPRTIVHLGAVSAADKPPGDIVSNGFYSLLALAKVIEERFPGEEIDLWTISANALAPFPGDGRAFAGATLLGAMRVLPQEILNVRCAHIDILPRRDVDGIRALAAQLLIELSQLPCEQPVALRGRDRWVRRIEPLRILPTSRRTNGLRRNGVYLITGGFGAVGRTLARHLAHTLQARLVLLGRNTAPPRETWAAWLTLHASEDATSNRIRLVQELEALGSEVYCASADVTDESRMRAVFDEIHTRFGSLNGVFHAAGCSDPDGFRTIRMTDRASCELHFRPKLQALPILQRIVDNESVDFVMLFSSLGAVLGGLGFFAYAAANTAMDSFADAARHSAASPWIAVDWDTWRVRDREPAGLGRTIAHFEMSPAEAIGVTEAILTYLPPHVIVSTGNLEARFRQWVRMTGFADQSRAPCHDRPLLNIPYAAPESELEEKLCTIWQSIFGLATIGIDDNFFELGGHSLMATRLIGRVRRTFRVDIPLTVLFDAPTIRQFSEQIEHRIIDEIETGRLESRNLPAN